MTNMKWHVYIVECSDGSLYTGVAKDLENRITKHNNGTGAKYTRSRRPVTLVYAETTADKSSALQREHLIKQLKRVEKLSLITGRKM